MNAPRRRTRRLPAALAAAAVALAGIAAAGGPSQAAGPAERPGKAHGKAPKDHSLVDVQLLSFNDFHGNLEGPSGSSGRNTEGYRVSSDGKSVSEVGHVGPDGKEVSDGGAQYLATHLAQARRGHPRSLTVAAGDIIGASPLLSAAFHDEPTIESMNALGLDATAVGNHEFDEGYLELQRMAHGGCLADGDGAGNQDSCPGGKEFRGAKFPMLAANVRYAGTDRTILPPYTIKKVGKARIGFIGMTLQQTPDIVTASGVAGLEFDNEVATANKLVPVLQAQGVNAIVVLIHQGANLAKTDWQDPATARSWKVNPTWNATCGPHGKLDAGSPILPIAQQLDPEIDIVISGHTHQPYVCDVPDRTGQSRMVTSASSFGRLFTETELEYDTTTNDIVRTSVRAANMRVSRDVAKDPAQTDLIATYDQLVLPIASRVLGTITSDVTNTANPAGESQLGDLIADAQLADTSVVTGGEVPVVAFMNPGGIRTSLTYASTKYADRGEQPGDVTYEEAFAVQPFNNYLVSLTLTGAQIQKLLDEQVTGANEVSNKILQVSKGFTYSYQGKDVIDDSVRLDGAPLVDTQTYRVVTNNFLADGGDGFPTFKAGTNRYVGGLDIDAFADHLTAQPGGYTPAPLTRITKLG